MKKSSKVLANTINNALLLATKEVDDKRKKYLGQYASALLKPLLDHIDSEDLDLNNEDGVFILLALATVLQARITKNVKLPTMGEIYDITS